MRIRVKLYATLRRYRPNLGHGEATYLELPDGATLHGLLDALGIKQNEAARCFVNGVAKELNDVLREGDEVVLFPPVAGGIGQPLPNWLPPSEASP